MKERKYFWCSGELCGSTLGGRPRGHDKHQISELAMELKGRCLCQTCYDNGLRLRIAAEVYSVKRGGENVSLSETKMPGEITG